MDNPENPIPEDPEVTPENTPLPEEVTESSVEAGTPAGASSAGDAREERLASPDELAAAELSIEDETPVVKEESKVRIFFRKLVRWTAGLLIVFGLGFGTAIFALYLPKTNELKAAKTEVSDVSGNISDLEAQISELEAQLASVQSQMSDLETTNQDLLTQQAGFELQITIQQARLDVANAQIALFEENPSQASLHLENTGKTLNDIGTMLPEDKKGAIDPLQGRLNLALGEIETAPDTAIDDLTILAKNLLDLELSLLTE